MNNSDRKKGAKKSPRTVDLDSSDRKRRTVTGLDLARGEAVGHQQIELIEGDVVVKAPEVLRVQTHGLPILSKFLQEIRDASLFDSRKTVVVDFVGMHRLSPFAALILSAELRRSISVAPPGKSFRMLYSREQSASSSALSVLANLRVFELFGGSPPATLKQDFRRGRPRSRLYHGTGVDSTTPLKNLVRGYAWNSGISVPSYKALTLSIIEIMDNVPNHAYKGALRRYVINNGWWLLGVRDEKKSKVIFALYDQGVGIPESLRDASIANYARHLVGEKDCELLERAVTIGGLTEVKGPKARRRGTGLTTLADYVKNEPNSFVQIISGAGCFGLGSANTDRLQVQRETLKEHFPGTMVLWGMNGSRIEELE